MITERIDSSIKDDKIIIRFSACECRLIKAIMFSECTGFHLNIYCKHGYGKYLSEIVSVDLTREREREISAN